MSTWVWTAGLIAGSAVLNVSGVVLLRIADQSGNSVLAVLGCMCWAATSAIFLSLLNTGHHLAVLSTLTSAAGALAVILIGNLLFDQHLSHRQLAGIGVLIAGMTLLSLPE